MPAAVIIIILVCLVIAVLSVRFFWVGKGGRVRPTTYAPPPRLPVCASCRHWRHAETQDLPGFDFTIPLGYCRNGLSVSAGVTRCNDTCNQHEEADPESPGAFHYKDGGCMITLVPLLILLTLACVCLGLF